MDTKVGAVITFKGVTEHQVREFLAEWNSDLEKDGSEFAFDSILTGTYDPEWEYPIFMSCKRKNLLLAHGLWRCQCGATFPIDQDTCEFCGEKHGTSDKTG